LSLQEASEITIEDREALRCAVKSLEHPSLAGRLTNLVGKPVELIGYALPAFASQAIASATSKGLDAALKVALRTLRCAHGYGPGLRQPHKLHGSTQSVLEARSAPPDYPFCAGPTL
jgi:hypothetical protein